MAAEDMRDGEPLVAVAVLVRLDQMLEM